MSIKWIRLIAGTVIFSGVMSITACVFSLSGGSSGDGDIVLLDTTKITWDRAVKILIPIYDTDVKFSGKTGSEELRADAVVHENGADVRYTVSSQSFGYWDNTLEYKWNMYLIKSYFFYQEGLFPISSNKTPKSLYEAVGKIDRYTRYADSAAAEEQRQGLFTSSSNGVIGIRLTMQIEDTLVIKQVAPGSPAEKAGLVKGMKVLKVNDEDVTGDSAVNRFSEYSKGDSGIELSITVKNEDGEITVSIIKDVVDFPTVLLDTIDNFAHLQVFSFTQKTYDNKSTLIEFREALTEALNFNVVLIDLRDNPGGSVGQVIPMCDDIISDGVIIHTTERRPDPWVPVYHTEKDEAVSGGIGESGKYILLGNSHSASAAEIMISAIMEANNAPLVGDTTFGKGIGQIVIKNTPGDGMAIVTSLQFTSRNNNAYHGKGIVPTYNVGGGSEALEKALDLAREMDNRPVAKGSARIDRKKQIAVSELNRQERIRYLEP